MREPPWDRLREAALAVRLHAHAPHSGFLVGAALWTEDGQIFVGANVENASYGLTLCAERSAVSALVSGGRRDFGAVYVVGDSPGPVTPCGACRQVLHEFSPGALVRCANLAGQRLDTTVSALLPHAFDAGALDPRGLP